MRRAFKGEPDSRVTFVDAESTARTVKFDGDGVAVTSTAAIADGLAALGHREVDPPAEPAPKGDKTPKEG